MRVVERFGATVSPADLKTIPFVTSPRGVVRRDTEDRQLRASASSAT